jgi:hypothetical protein
MQSAKIDVTKIDKSLLFKGEKGIYMNVTLIEKETDYSDGFIVQDIGKERRQAGEKGPIIGNWKHIKQAQSAKPQPAAQTQPEDDDDVPF